MAPPRTRPYISCEICGNIFYQRNDRQRTCSYLCRDKLPKPKVKIVCETCSNAFYVSPGIKRKSPNKRFCSSVCRQIGHRVKVTQEEINKRFWSNVKVDSPDQCWEWQGPRFNTGYGCLAIGNNWRDSTHRLSWKLHYGEIPKLQGAHGGVIMHKCDNRICVNPIHLQLGTQKENLQDMYIKGRNRGYRQKGYVQQEPNE